jgi:Rrf2 family protein
MKLTRASEYAIHAVVNMAATGENGRPVASHNTAAAKGIPERFLLKVLKPLVSAGVLYSVKGPNGGYRLAKPANKITLLEIIEAVDGPMRGDVPRVEGKETEATDQRLKEICQQITDQTRKQLEKVRISELVGKSKNGSR